MIAVVHALILAQIINLMGLKKAVFPIVMVLAVGTWEKCNKLFRVANANLAIN